MQPWQHTQRMYKHREQRAASREETMVGGLCEIVAQRHKAN